MFVLAVFFPKGGSGKSTLAIHLAVAAQIKGRKVAILDIDPQASSSAWRSHRSTLLPVVVKIPAGSLERAIASAKSDEYGLAILDCPPAVSSLTARIIELADLIVVPVRPTPLDLAALPDALTLIGSKPFVFVVSDAPFRAREVEEARLALQKLGPVLGVITSRRVMWRAMLTGQAVSEVDPDGKAASEVCNVCDLILEKLDKDFTCH